MFCEGIVPLVRYSEEALIRYLVAKIDPFSHKSWVMVYAHSGTANSSALTDLMKEWFRAAQLKYERTLVNLYVLHPTWAFRAMYSSYFSYFLWDTLYNNTEYFETIQELKKHVGNPNLPLVPIIQQYEAERESSLLGGLF